jgi:hypothetical protein
MTTARRTLFFFLAALALAACGPTVGDPCTTQNECGGQVCSNADFAPGGYCTRQCTLGDDRTCPGGTICIRDFVAKGLHGCGRICKVKEECRVGYECRVVRESPLAICVGPTGI